MQYLVSCERETECRIKVLETKDALEYKGLGVGRAQARARISARAHRFLPGSIRLELEISKNSKARARPELEIKARRALSSLG